MEKPFHIAILPLYPCSMLSISCAADPFTLANRLSGRKLYEILFYSLDGKPVKLNHDSTLPVHGSIFEYPACDQLFIICESPPNIIGSTKLNKLLTRMATRSILLGGIDFGAWYLAQAGLLNGYRASIHWSEQSGFVENFPKVITSQNLYEYDRNRFTSGGCLAALNGILDLISLHVGREIVEYIAEALCVERIRSSNERQRTPLATRIGDRQPKLTEAVMLMEANIEEPLTSSEIARLTCQSRRQLERLFKQFFDTTPSRFYLQLRLDKARTLLQRTNKTVLQIALNCGFSSGPHFSTVYRANHGITPHKERLQDKKI